MHDADRTWQPLPAALATAAAGAAPGSTVMAVPVVVDAGLEAMAGDSSEGGSPG